MMHRLVSRTRVGRVGPTRDAKRLLSAIGPHDELRLAARFAPWERRRSGSLLSKPHVRIARLGLSVRLPSKGVRWQLAEAALVGPGEIAEVPEAPPQGLGRHRGRA